MKQKDPFIFSKSNYTLMAIGVVMILVGFALMVTNNSNPEEFNPAVYGFRQITLAPMIIIGGFILEFIAIFKK